MVTQNTKDISNDVVLTSELKKSACIHLNKLFHVIKSYHQLVCTTNLIVII